MTEEIGVSDKPEGDEVSNTQVEKPLGGGEPTAAASRKIDKQQDWFVNNPKT